jgi:hypothetical protein
VAVEGDTTVDGVVGPADQVTVAVLVSSAVHVLGFEAEVVGLPRGVEDGRGPCVGTGDALDHRAFEQSVNGSAGVVDPELLARPGQQTP